MNKKLKVYYAHPISTYGKLQEKEDLAQIAKIFPAAKIVNPNTKEHKVGYTSFGMEYFKQVVQKCGVVVFRSFEDGKIGAGVAKEIQWGRENGAIILEIHSELTECRVLTVNQTKNRLSCLKRNDVK